MNKIYNPKLTPNSQKLRKQMTKEERHLWYDFLKTIGVTVHRQKTIGNYIVDFYIPSKKLVIELDGEQHYADKANIVADAKRDNELSKLGIEVLRYSNLEIKKNFRGVCETIYSRIYKED